MLGKKYYLFSFFLNSKRGFLKLFILRMDLNIMWSELPICSLSVIKVAVVYTN